ncbi:MAG: tetratricopeptide repeat protein [Pseudomonadota bacterium]
MSNTDTDSFIREVTEEVRQDRMLRYWKKYGPYIIGGILVIVAASATVAWLEAQQQQAAYETGDVLIQAREAAESGGPEAVTGLIAEVDGPARTIALMQAAQAFATAGRAEDAMAQYRTIAEDGTLPLRYSDLARLELARLQAAAGQSNEALSQLDGMILSDGPYRLLALELRAALRLTGGDLEGAQSDVLAVLTDPFATADTRARVQALQATLPTQALIVPTPADEPTPEAPADGTTE